MEYHQLLALTTAILINGTVNVPEQIENREIQAVLGVAQRIVDAAAERQAGRP